MTVSSEKANFLTVSRERYASIDTLSTQRLLKPSQELHARSLKLLFSYI